MSEYHEFDNSIATSHMEWATPEPRNVPGRYTRPEQTWGRDIMPPPENSYTPPIVTRSEQRALPPASLLEVLRGQGELRGSLDSITERARTNILDTVERLRAPRTTPCSAWTPIDEGLCDGLMKTLEDLTRVTVTYKGALDHYCSTLREVVRGERHIWEANDPKVTCEDAVKSAQDAYMRAHLRAGDALRTVAALYAARMGEIQAVIDGVTARELSLSSWGPSASATGMDGENAEWGLSVSGSSYSSETH